MDHSMHMSSDSTEAAACKINMLWNWYTVDACFLSESWQITSNGMFAGSMIGVVLLVILLEFFRRLGKEYDRYILRDFQRSIALQQTISNNSITADEAAKNGVNIQARRLSGPTSFRPNVLQQAIRALLHMVTFAIAYFVMLLAMYYNGYLIISIFIGAFLGSFIFSWETVQLGTNGPEEDPTVCCG